MYTSFFSTVLGLTSQGYYPIPLFKQRCWLRPVIGWTVQDQELAAAVPDKHQQTMTMC
jgi:hypothetical protein